MGLIDRWDTADGLSAPPYCYNIAIFQVAFLLPYLPSGDQISLGFRLAWDTAERSEHHLTATHFLPRQLFVAVFTIGDQISLGLWLTWDTADALKAPPFCYKEEFKNLGLKRLRQYLIEFE